MIKKKQNLDAETKSALQKSCQKDLYNCIKTIGEKKPSLFWLPVYHAALQYQLKSKDIEIDKKSQKNILGLVPDYVNIIVSVLTSAFKFHCLFPIIKIL